MDTSRFVSRGRSPPTRSSCSSHLPLCASRLQNHLIFQWLRRWCNTAKTPIGKRPERYQVTPFELSLDSVDHWFHLGRSPKYIRTATAASAIFYQEGDVASYDSFQMLHYVNGFLDFKRPGGGSCIAFCGRSAQFDKAWSFSLAVVRKPQPGASLH